MEEIAVDERADVSRLNWLAAVSTFSSSWSVHDAWYRPFAASAARSDLDVPIVGFDETFDDVPHFQETDVAREREARRAQSLFWGVLEHKLDGHPEFHRVSSLGTR
jgi:hypothetical protein